MHALAKTASFVARRPRPRAADWADPSVPSPALALQTGLANALAPASPSPSWSRVVLVSAALASAVTLCGAFWFVAGLWAYRALGV